MNILPKTHERVARFFESFIYGGRWVLAPMYVGLLVTLFIYTWRFLKELFELVHHLVDLTEAEIMPWWAGGQVGWRPLDKHMNSNSPSSTPKRQLKWALAD